MTYSTIETYRNRQQEILANLDEMHRHSNWTPEMEKLEEQLNNKFEFLQKRILEIEDMISFYDGWEYITSE